MGMEGKAKMKIKGKEKRSEYGISFFQLVQSVLQKNRKCENASLYRCKSHEKMITGEWYSYC